MTARSLNRAMWLLALFQGARMLVGSYSIAYLTAHGLTLVQVGLLKSLQMSLLLALDIPSSHLADRFGRRAANLASIAAAAVWLGISAVGRGFAAFALAECFNAASLAIGSGVAISYVIGLSQALPDPPSVKEVAGRAGQQSTFAMAIAALLGTFHASTDSRWPWVAACAGCAVIGCVALALFPDDLRFRSPVVRGSASFAAVLGGFFRDVRGIGLGRTVAWAVFVAVVAQVFIQFWQVALLPPGGAARAGSLFGITFALLLLGQFAAAWLLRAASHRVVRGCIWAALAAAGAALTTLRRDDTPGGVAALVLASFGLRLAVIDVQARLHDRFPEHSRSTYDSMVSTLARVALIPVLLGAGAVMSGLGGRGIGLLALCLCLALSIRWCAARA